MTQMLIFCTMYAFFNVLGATIIKNSLLQHSLGGVESYINFFLQWKIVIAMLVIFMSMLMIMKALSISKFSLVIPVATGINFVFTLMMGYFFFGDRVTYITILGILLIFFGILLIGTVGENTI